MAIAGADTQALRGLGDQMTKAGQQLTDIAADVSIRIQSTGWLGPDCEQFRENWEGMLSLRLRRCADSLLHVSRILHEQAQQQDDASAAGTPSAREAGDSRPRTQRDVDSDGPDRTRETVVRDGGQPGNPNGSLFDLGSGFRKGEPTKPHIVWDQDFEYESEFPTLRDYVNYAKWHATGVGGLVVGLDDASALYLHYLGSTGDPKTFDMHEAYIEDTGMRNSIDYEITSAAFAADRLATSDGTWKITGEPHLNIEYPTTQNWQKTVGGYQQWTSATITRSGEHVTMRVTVHGEDFYNFNEGQSDISTGISDDENGRFTTVGLAKPFHSSGAYTREITWRVGDPPSREDLARDHP